MGNKIQDMDEHLRVVMTFFTGADPNEPTENQLSKAPPREWIQRLFEELGHTFGQSWISQFVTDEVLEAHINTWRIGLIDRTGREMALALEKCRKKKPGRDGKVWPPNLPEFNAMCDAEPEDAGLPPVEEAYKLACARKWPHPAIYDAAVRVGIFNLRNLPAVKTRERFANSYKITVGKVFRGEEIQGVRTNAPALKKKELSKEARKALSVDGIKGLREALKRDKS